ncbi:WG repeat-containing protein [Sediminimonas qiaohouensis]|uniref:WG repeat-containing protein n=1 Tax=Sediminimonas qiaohouensis TaxID=552061 RepID=UPI00041496FB|nr:WG repeat-containing protein [Sediminimonas qiaohouensis]
MRKLIITAVGAGILAVGGYLLYIQSDGGCADGDCFVAAVQACEPEAFRTRAAGAEGVYRVVGPSGPACEISFEYSENPNPSFVDKPVTFTVSPDDASEDTVRGALKACMTGRTGKYECGGPLFEQLTYGAPAYASLEYGGDGPLPCGTPVEVDGEPLYPMPKDGQWGYVNRDGDWKISPQWNRAGDFHEGRAIVGGRNAWGIIDRDGEAIVAPEHASDVDGRPPFTSYSEGCTVANIFTDTSQPAFFLDRDGKAYWRDRRPEGLAELDIEEFGSFSEGLAWFQIGSVVDEQHGWIDASGEIAIAPDFANSGDFNGGLAPASLEDHDQFGFISPDGRLQLPRKWTLDGAQPFSEGLAQVSTGAFEIAFMDSNDFAFHDVTLSDEDTGPPVRAEIEAAGAFHEGLAPVDVEYDDTREFGYMNQQGEMVFVPDRLDGITVCDARLRPEFHNGLVRLVVADNGESCGDEAYLDGAPAYDAAHYVYLDTLGHVVLRQAK